MNMQNLMGMFSGGSVNPMQMLQSLVGSSCAPAFQQQIASKSSEMIYAAVNKASCYLCGVLSDDDKKVIMKCTSKNEAVKLFLQKSIPALVDMFCQKDIDYVYDKMKEAMDGK